MYIKILNQENFDEYLSKKRCPIIVDFWSNWCNPCKAIAPILEEISIEMREKIKIVKIDVDKNPKLVEKFFVRSIPMLIMFKNNKKISYINGVMPKFEIIKWIDNNLNI